VPIASGVARLVAPNGSAMTGPGTNTYLLGDPVVAILDPGPADAAHVAAIASAAPQARWLFATHTHKDHSPAAARLGEMLGATLVGRPPPNDGRQDTTFLPQVMPVRDQVFTLTPGLTLRAIDTPGHASNHVCFLADELGLLFSGDHLLDGVTPVILAPDGDMTQYLDSLERLKLYPLNYVAPGHGRVLPAPMELIDRVIAHRLRREARVLENLRALRRATLEELLPRVYSEVSPSLYGFARCSLDAHLIKLERDGHCASVDGAWEIR
jgi:glyoxylase-like metal-dependent hydrolase (beta-lactamase superfamily II)